MPSLVQFSEKLVYRLIQGPPSPIALIGRREQKATKLISLSRYGLSDIVSFNKRTLQLADTAQISASCIGHGVRSRICRIALVFSSSASRCAARAATR